MNIENNILKHYLKNAYFITGTPYAGKSTMVKMLAEKFDLLACEENYHSKLSNRIAEPSLQPNLSYFKTMKDWQEFIGRTPQEYANWIKNTSIEASEFEIAELIAISQNKKVIVDTNIPLDLLHEIADYNQVAVMLAPQSISVDYFFDREDPEKKFLLEEIKKAPNPEHALENFKNGIALINNQEIYDEYENSGFFCMKRQEVEKDTKKEVLERLAQHFGFKLT